MKSSLSDLEISTAGCSGFLVNICMSYGSRAEIVNACKEVSSLLASGTIKIDEIDEKLISEHMLTKSLPGHYSVQYSSFKDINTSHHIHLHVQEPDILVRTSGEYRLSNFLLWQLAYTEMFFIDKFWPDISEKDLVHIISQYQNRSRRFGT